MPSPKEMFTELSLSSSFLISKRGSVELDGDGKRIIGIRGWLGGWNRNGFLRYSQERCLSGSLLELGLQNGMVDSYIKRICTEINRRPNSTMVAYSMGGLIALRYLQFHGSSKINKLILIGCPLNGTRHARYLQRLGGVYADLAPQSKLLKELQNFDPGIETVHLLAAWDQFVGNPQNIQGPGQKIILPINGHIQLMNDSKHVGKVLDEIL